MFRRREKKTLLQRFSSFFWPKMGWLRTGNYWVYRVSRLPGSVYSIASGFACGAAVSFTPFVGIHFILGGLLAWFLRGSIVASAIGTAIGNPWTFPFIWIWIYKLGLWMGFGIEEQRLDFDFAAIFGQAGEAALKFDFDHLLYTTWPILWPMLAGSIPTALIMWLVFYYSIGHVINSYRSSRVEKIQSKPD